MLDGDVHRGYCIQLIKGYVEMKVIFQVKNMHCGSCVMRLEGLEDELPGIQKISASYHKQQMEVELDENRISLEKVILAAKQIGYDLEIISGK